MIGYDRPPDQFCGFTKIVGCVFERKPLECRRMPKKRNLPATKEPRVTPSQELLLEKKLMCTLFQKLAMDPMADSTWHYKLSWIPRIMGRPTP